MIDTADIFNHLPLTIVQEIILYINKEMLEPMFKEFNSDKMIKDLS